MPIAGSAERTPYSAHRSAKHVSAIDTARTLGKRRVRASKIAAAMSCTVKTPSSDKKSGDAGRRAARTSASEKTNTD